jgi:hypothetical protein
VWGEGYRSIVVERQSPRREDLANWTRAFSKGRRVVDGPTTGVPGHSICPPPGIISSTRHALRKLSLEQEMSAIVSAPGHQLVPQSASLPDIVILSLRRISLSTSSNFEEAESGILRRASSG